MREWQFRLLHTQMTSCDERIHLFNYCSWRQVVSEVQYSRNGVTVKTEDGHVYTAEYIIVSVSVGVLQSNLITFSPPLPVSSPNLPPIHSQISKHFILSGLI